MARGEAIEVYCDESRLSGGDFLLMGGVWIRQRAAQGFCDRYFSECDRLCLSRPGHLKWEKVPSRSTERYMQLYLGLVDLFLDHMGRNDVFFRTVIVRRSQFDLSHPSYNADDSEVGFHKLYYYLITPCLSPTHQYHVRVASRNPAKRKLPYDQEQRLDTLKMILNNGARKHHCYGHSHDVVRSVEARPERSSLHLQLVDVLTGAVGYHWEELEQRLGARDGKVMLAGYIAQRLGRPDLRFTTTSDDRSFNVFHLIPRAT